MEKENYESKKSTEREASELENGKDTNSQESGKEPGIDSPEIDENNRMNIPDLVKREETKAPELERDASDLEKRIIRNTSELKKRMKRNSFELKNRRNNSDAEKKTDTTASELEKTMDVSKLEERTNSDASELKEKEGSALEKRTLEVGVELEKRTGEGAAELVKRNETFSPNSHSKGNIPDETIERVDETNVPLLVGDTISIEMKGGPEGKPTVHVHAKKNQEAAAKKKVGMNPMQRMKNTWNTSSNVCTFFLRAILILFTTLGWMMCVGGIPFVSIAMIAIGSLYFDDCRVQPNIPLYLVVGGVCGTIQHVIAFWNKYLPEEAQGRLSVYRRWYSLIDGAMTLFLFIWFILGCVWVYGVKEVEFQDDYKDEYCHKTLYYFAFWLLNISFIIIAVVMVLGLCAILCIVTLPKDEAVVNESTTLY